MEVTSENIITLFERQNMEQFIAMGGLEKFTEHFHTDLQSGLSKEEKADNYRTRKLEFGRNILPDPPKMSWGQMFWRAFLNLTLQILIISAFISLILAIAFPGNHTGSGGRWLDFLDPIAIFVAVFLVAFIEAQTNFVQQKNFIEINKMKNEYNISVIRMGEEMQIKNTELLCGDILALKNGDKVAADGIYITGHNLKIDTSQETGESVAVEVNEDKPFILGGAAVESGDAHVLVCAVGELSQSGVNMMKIQQMTAEHEKSPLERKLDALSIKLTYIGIIGAGLTFLVLLIMWIVDIANVKWKSEYMNTLVSHLMVGITIFICAVPEGLPLATTLSLGFSMKVMVKDNVFVRHLNACETMGGATTICSDKTGTLTQNRMTVVKFFSDNTTYNENPDAIPKPIKDALIESVAINSSAYLSPGEWGEPDRYVGSSSECALLQYIEKMGADYKQLRDDYPIAILHEFNSTRKRMSTIVSYHDKWRVYAKGAPDFMMHRCTRYLAADGTKVPLTEDIKNEILDKVIEFADEALRTILVAYNDIDCFEMDPAWVDAENVEKDLTMIGIAGIIDPLRPEVVDAIESCKRAGVMVRMVTGDYINTAKAIARNCGILDDDGIAMTGLEFSTMSKLELLPLLPKIQVVARSSPRDKYRLVGLLMEAGEVVAVTGDGSNDSAALKRANVGMAMGMCGTELAKMASDVVILDDNFASIVTALKWGRCVYDNVRGYLNYQLTVNWCAMIVAFVGSCANQESPLKAIQLLWINLCAGALGALALASQRPVDSLLDRHPYGENDPVISNLMTRNIAGQLIYQLFVLFLELFGYEKVFKIHDKTEGLSLVFATFVYMQIFNLINVRVQGANQKIYEGLFSNPYFIIIFVLLCGLQAVISQFGGSAFQITSMNGKEWGITLGFSVFGIVIGEILRCIKLPDHTKESLEATRAAKRTQMEEFYHNMSPAQMWEIENTPANINEVPIDP